MDTELVVLSGVTEVGMSEVVEWLLRSRAPQRADSAPPTMARKPAALTCRPEVLGRNGAYASFRKLVFGQYAPDHAEEDLLAAKFVWRWPCLRRRPGDLKCRTGAHARRMNPRDSLIHRRGAPALHDPARTYPAAAGRGIMFAFLGRTWTGGLSHRRTRRERTRWSAATTTAIPAADPRPLGVARVRGQPGGEYGFIPGLGALRWLAVLGT